MLTFKTTGSREAYLQALATLPAGTDYSSLLFFDIETTGLSPASAQIYMIGALSFPKEGPPVLRQWFAASLSEEQELLRSFFAYAAPFRTLVHFNGNRFDLPFLNECSAQYHLPNSLNGKTSLDLYANIAPFRSLLGAQKLTQRALEQRLRLTREDPFTGAELIAQYLSWLSTRDEALLQNLLAHNAADVSSLPLLLPLLRISDFFRAPITTLALSSSGGFVTFCGESTVSLPFSLAFDSDRMKLAANENKLSLTLPLFSGSLYHYLKDYRNYYILKEDGSLLHKTLASFVDVSAREKASRETARLPLSGDFVAVPKRMKPNTRCFQLTPNSKVLYLPLSALREDASLCNAYFSAVLGELKLRS